jgi:tyrosyl-tRNA synthetase
MKSKILQELQWRGFIKDSNDLENLDTKLFEAEQSGTGITLYTGYDLTAKSLHAGNLMTLMMMRHFQKCGHKVIALLGGATTQIGDPTGKDAMRKPLTDEQIQQNLRGINANFSQILLPSFEVVNNNDWLGSIGYLQILKEVGAYFSVNSMIKMDSVESRLAREQSMSFLEFNYMLFQGYDFYHLAKTKNCILQIGGSDQWGNIVQGVKVANRILGVETFALTCPLITRADGAKMGKSVGGAVWLSKEMLSHFDYFQYFRNIDDADIRNFLRFFTELTRDEIENLQKLKGKEINDAKKILAFEATKICHGEVLALEALKSAEGIFEEKNQESAMEEFRIQSRNIVDVLVEVKFATSKSEAKTLIKQNSIRIDGNLCTEIATELNASATIQVGKKKFMRVILP